MKKLLLATAVAALSLSVQAAPTLYGKINLTLDYVDNNKFDGNSNLTELNSNASRIGIKGEEALTDNISLLYLAEWQISADGDDSVFENRNRFLGLKFKDIGTFKAGQFDSYFKTSAGKYQDIFNDHKQLDITKVMYGEERLKNVIGFETDKKLLGGLQFNIMSQQGEGAASKYTTEKRDSIGDSISTSVSYENKNIGVAVAVAGDLGVQGKYNASPISDKIESDAYRVTGSLDFSNLGLKGFVLGGLWQHAEPSDSPSAAALTAASLNPAVASLEEEAFLVSATYSIPNTLWTVKGQYQTVDTSWNGTDRTVDQYGAGVDYNFNKQTRFYGVLAQQKRDWGNDTKKTVFGLGMEYNF